MAKTPNSSDLLVALDEEEVDVESAAGVATLAVVAGVVMWWCLVVVGREWLCSEE